MDEPIEPTSNAAPPAQSHGAATMDAAGVLEEAAIEYMKILSTSIFTTGTSAKDDVEAVLLRLHQARARLLERIRGLARGEGPRAARMAEIEAGVWRMSESTVAP